eukprot:CAMPEP_0171128920 /NCGR_PEP_ID=MMETSP0766_2-20121228/118004_1 /TAXON_ID=439317 /ORGANISM="Gambierdiscus australes, Strain CAWD 149" /LENGTH=130 /DNA_ID=CAMNT_0011592093 /DNA_START=35 /DNA_END=427 /DNA_ORIENTATION=+
MPANPVLQQAMKSDPDVRAMMEDIQANGPSAVQKYLGNEELMAKMGRLTNSTNLAGARLTPGAKDGRGASEAAADPKRELRRRAQRERRQKASQEKGASKQEEFEKRRDQEDAEAWEAMQREMAEIDARK